MAAELYSAAQVREMDRRAIAELGIPGYTLMQRAAAACWTVLTDHWPDARRIAIVCGSGNNGGDGYEIASLARKAGREVVVLETGDAPRHGDAVTARTAWLETGTVAPFGEQALRDAGVIVDAIFGIGLSRASSGVAAAAIAAINAAHQAGAGVLAVDIPSGLMADTGTVPGVAVEADLTMTFIGRKFGLFTGQGPAQAGRVLFDALALPESDLRESGSGIATLIHRDELRGWLPPRRRTAHKGDHGHVLLIGGDHGMAGAILIAARAALRAGAGLVTVATRAEHVAALAAAQPEIMFHAVEDEAALHALLDKADVVAVGPGLGQRDWGSLVFDIAMTAAQPLVVDADGLNLLAQRPDPRRPDPLRPDLRRDDWLLTPHPGEAGRLLGVATHDIQADRAAAVTQLQARYGGSLVLKGAGSLIRGPREMRLCPYGNPGMGVGGMGDALTGIAAALMAQGLAIETAAAAAVTAHALAGDQAARAGERGLVVSDLIAALREVVNP